MSPINTDILWVVGECLQKAYLQHKCRHISCGPRVEKACMMVFFDTIHHDVQQLYDEMLMFLKMFATLVLKCVFWKFSPPTPQKQCAQKIRADNLLMLSSRLALFWTVDLNHNNSDDIYWFRWILRSFSANVIDLICSWT